MYSLALSRAWPSSRKLSGDGQQAPAGTRVEDPLVVEVRDQNGAGFPGVAVEFVVTQGDATLSASGATTDERGRASSVLTMGTEAGTITVEVRVSGLVAQIFSLTAIPAPPGPNSLAKLSGDEQQGPVWSVLTEPLVVQVLDQHGNGFEGAEVIFAISGGAGTLSVVRATTDALGQATCLLTPQVARETIVQVTVEGLEPVTFTAVGLLVPVTLTILSGDGQEGPVRTALTKPLVVEVLDQNGTRLEGVEVSFAVIAGDAMLSVERAITDSLGQAASLLTPVVVGDPVRVEVTVEGLEPVAFSAVGQASPDFNADGQTDFEDFFLFAEGFGGTDPRFDLDNSGSVDFTDFFLFVESFGQPARAKLMAMARDRIGLPEGPQLAQNAPNPFNSGTVISWFQLQPGLARLEVFALTGQRVAVLHEGATKAGFHRLRWDARSDQGHPLATGVYVYRLVTAEGAWTRKLTLLQ